jgi:hypothetical protein
LLPAELSGAVTPNPAVNPVLKAPSGGYFADLCNTSATRGHTVTGLFLRITDFIPYGGRLNAYSICDGFYARPQGLGGGGCGGAVADPNPGTATFAARAAAGVTVAISNPTRTPLPSPVKPGDSYGLNLGIVPPTIPGTYTFALGVGLDGAAPAFVPLPYTVLLAPVAHKWTGQACEAPAMLRAIPPATNPPTAYICPVL